MQFVLLVTLHAACTVSILDALVPISKEISEKVILKAQG